jgi:hypothetical protein
MPDQDLDPTVAVEHATDLLELAELLAFLSTWLASDPDLAASLTRFVAHRAYDLYQLRVDLDRFTFLLGADHDGPPHPPQPLVKETLTT